MCRKLICLSSLVLLLSLASTTYADFVIGNWEQNMDGWKAAWEGAPTFSYSNIGATLGSWSLGVNTGGSGYWILQRDGLLNLTGAKFAVDVTWIASEWPAGSWSQLDKLAVNSNLGWREFQPPTVIDRTTGLPAAQRDWGPWAGDVYRTYIYDLSGADWTGEITWMQIILAIQSNSAQGIIHLDNAKLVGVPATITVAAGGDIAAANATAQAGDTIEIAAGTFYLTSQIAIKSGVTYRGAGPGLTIIDGNNVTRAFVAWGDRFFNEDTGNPNNSGPKDWVLEGITIQNCVADTNDRFSYTSAAFNLKTNFATRDTNASGGLDPNEANTQVDGIRLPGPDGTEGTADDDIHRFAHIDTDSSGQISMAELDAQLLLREDEFGSESGDGGAITIANEAVGTIKNCEFLNNHTPAEGDGDDGGAVNITGLSVVTINDCLFNGNYACSANSVAITGSDGDGGHIKVQGGSASAITPGTTLIANRCIFKNGNASDDGGAIEVSSTGNVVRLDSCKFEGNTSWDNGNVLRFGSNTQNGATVTNCIFVNNITKADGGPDRMIEAKRNSKFINCTFVGNNQFDEDIIYNNANTADTDGDGVDDEMTDTTQVVNCIFVNNIIGDGDHVLGSRNANFSIAATNCLFFGNKRQNGSAGPNCQRIETGSVNANPLLDANYVPGAGSPAIDAGVDPAIVGVTLTTDFNGAPRPQGAAYDIGAFEAP